MNLDESENVNSYEADIAIMKKRSELQDRLIKEQLIMIELLETHNAELEKGIRKLERKQRSLERMRRGMR